MLRPGAVGCSGPGEKEQETSQISVRSLRVVPPIPRQLPSAFRLLLCYPKSRKGCKHIRLPTDDYFLCVIATYCVHCRGVSFWCEVVCSQCNCMRHSGRRKINCKLRDASRQFWLHRWDCRHALIVLNHLEDFTFQWSSLLAWTVASSMVCQAMCGWVLNLLPTSSLGRKLLYLWAAGCNQSLFKYPWADQ